MFIYFCLIGYNLIMKKLIFTFIFILPIILLSCSGSNNETEQTENLVIDSKNIIQDKQSEDTKISKNIIQDKKSEDVAVSTSNQYLAKTLSGTCNLDSQNFKVSCVTKRTKKNSVLKWEYDSRWWNDDNFEFDLHRPGQSETIITLEECIENSCNKIEIILDTSHLVKDSKNSSSKKEISNDTSMITNQMNSSEPKNKGDNLSFEPKNKGASQSFSLDKKNKDGSSIKLPQILFNYKNSWGRHCEGSGPVLFANSPMNMDDIAYLTPYGQVVGAHITPIDHMYFEPLERSLGPDIYEVRAIQDGIIYDIGKREIFTDTGLKKDFADWRLDIAHNCTFTSYFDLMTSVTPEIEKAYEDIKSGLQFDGLIIEAGQLLGYVGGQTLDFGVYDYEIVLPGFITPDLYNYEYWKVHTVDPFEYFPYEISEKLLKKMIRTIEPQAGKIDYDVDGTLSGNWFEQGTNGYAGKNPQNYWIGHLSIAPHEINPAYWRVGIGHLSVDDNVFLIQGNTDPVNVTVNSGVVFYELYHSRVYKNDYNVEWWKEPKKEKDGYGVQYLGDSKGIIMFEMLENRLLKSEVFIGKSKTDNVDFSENAKLYER